MIRAKNKSQHFNRKTIEETNKQTKKHNKWGIFYNTDHVNVDLSYSHTHSYTHTHTDTHTLLSAEIVLSRRKG